jgi:tetratricopeptide (TPR) repeat protein
MGPPGKHVIGWALAFLGDIPFLDRNFKEAQSFYEMSILALGEVGNKNMKAYPLRRLGYLALYRKEHENALEFFKESLALNHELRHQVGTIGSLAAFGGLAYAEENYTRSAKLLGAVEANLEALALLLLPSDRLEYSRNVANLGHQLEKQALADAWAEGCSMTLEQAVDFAFKA